MTPEPAGEQRRLLFIAFWFPPSRASGVYRALAAVRAFSNDGWKVSVLTTTRQFLLDEIGSIDESLVKEIPSGVNVIRVPFSFWKPPVSPDIRSVGWLWGNFPALHRYVTTATDRAWELLRRAINGRATPAVIETYSGWIEPAVSAAMRLYAEEPFDHILATGNPYSSFEVARVLSELTGKPFSIDFRDPWSFDLFTGRPKPLGARTLAAEARIIDAASVCFHVNDAMAKAYRQRYPSAADKQHVVRNGYDRDSLGSLHQPPGRDSPLRFGMIGTITDVWPIQPVFEAWEDCYPELPEGSELVLAGHLGYFDHRSDRVREMIARDSPGFSYLGPIEKGEVSRFYEQLDVVIVPVPMGEMVTSGKIYEALALGIPVICVQSEGGGARTLLDGRPATFEADPVADQVAETIRRAARTAPTLTAQEMADIRGLMAKHERLNAIRPMVEMVSSVTRLW